MNSNWIGPAIMKFGTEEQKRKHLPMIAAGTVSWCQGFSEPSAGSDLAALRTRAERTGESYRINGSKIWTSYAQSADYCFLLARTGGEKKTITVFLLPMDTPGIMVKPIKALVCDGSLNEVFLTDVHADLSLRLGEENCGWEIVKYALGQERSGSPKHVYAVGMLERAVAHLKANKRFDAPGVRERAARARAVCEAARRLAYRCVDIRAKDRGDSSEFNLARFLHASGENIVSDFITDFIPEAVAGESLPLLRAYVRRTTSAAIAVGSAEIQLNLIAQHYLHLPRGY
jgi:alkylation response protein AidB-like acyl-CoA dehydrogenase